MLESWLRSSEFGNSYELRVQFSELFTIPEVSCNLTSLLKTKPQYQTHQLCGFYHYDVHKHVGNKTLLAPIVTAREVSVGLTLGL